MTLEFFKNFISHYAFDKKTHTSFTCADNEIILDIRQVSRYRDLASGNSHVYNNYSLSAYLEKTSFSLRKTYHASNHLFTSISDELKSAWSQVNSNIPMIMY